MLTLSNRGSNYLLGMEKPEINPNVGILIKQARSALGLSQRAFADRLGVSQGLVGQWESHRKVPGAATLRRIADETGMSMDAIAAGSLPSSRTLTVTDGDEILLITLFRRLPKVAKHNALELLKMSSNLARMEEKKRGPLEVK